MTAATWEITQPTQEERDTPKICVTCKQAIISNDLTTCDHCHEYLHITAENECGDWVPGNEDDAYWCNDCLDAKDKLEIEEASSGSNI